MQNNNSLQIIQTIFCPNKYHLQRQKDSLKSLNESNKPIHTDIYLEGWTANDELWDSLVSYIKDLNLSSVYIKRRKENIGKSKIVNNIMNKGEFNNILYMDSDIILEKDTIMRLLKIQLEYPHSLLVPNYKEDCRHNLLIQKNVITTRDNDVLLSSENCIGISGGIYLIRQEIMKSYPFRENGPYSPDDIHFFEDLVKDNINIFICKEIFVIHPFDNNKKYSEWKQSKSMNLYHKDLSKEEIEVLIKDSYKIWELSE